MTNFRNELMARSHPQKEIPSAQGIFEIGDAPRRYLSDTWDHICSITFCVASLRRQTQPLRGYIRRRLARGACRPPSTPPIATAFERVHAFAWVESAQ